ncbi:MAG: DNA mismatch repair endonuclease MutL [Zetaproteobacteria bacterium]|nr:MAG: DNA mismatch repair endonuclease MutL [Zetaproteobacteria bacterium]
MGVIHVLPAKVANQIAAGEVVERPASAVKELVENSIDAGAKRVLVRIERGGKKRIEVEDDGCGMSAEDAQLALKRHATSKIATSEDLAHIASHGFRGEALPSIASVSRFHMHTGQQESDEGTEVWVEGGGAAIVRPAPPRRGTRIEVRDLFLNTPARLRFMRTERTEEAAVVETMRMLALANPAVSMALFVEGRARFDLPAQTETERVHAIMGRAFADDSVEQTTEYEGIVVHGWLALPTFHHRDASRIVLLLNGRVIRDRALLAAIRAGYRDVMFHDRYPVAVVRLEMDPAMVDVNVHPAKREVRFRAPRQVRAAVVACVRAAIERMGQRVSRQPTAQAMRRAMAANPPSVSRPSPVPRSGQPAQRTRPATSTDMPRLLFSVTEPTRSTYHVTDETGLDLGEPLAQIHRCYILSQTRDGIILVDQHAAHERMTYERLKRQLQGAGIAVQALLTPEPLQVSASVAAWLEQHAGELRRFGVELAIDDQERCWIRSIPALLADESPQALVGELIDACMLLGSAAEAGVSGQARIVERWLGNRACKCSIKSGRKLSSEEQRQLLREMERTPNIAQCNHGRPTYIRLSLDDLDRLFGRRD